MMVIFIFNSTTWPSAVSSPWTTETYVLFRKFICPRLPIYQTLKSLLQFTRQLGWSPTTLLYVHMSRQADPTSELALVEPDQPSGSWSFTIVIPQHSNLRSLIFRNGGSLCGWSAVSLQECGVLKTSSHVVTDADLLLVLTAWYNLSIRPLHHFWTLQQKKGMQSTRMVWSKWTYVVALWQLVNVTGDKGTPIHTRAQTEMEWIAGHHTQTWIDKTRERQIESHRGTSGWTETDRAWERWKNKQTGQKNRQRKDGGRN